MNVAFARAVKPSESWERVVPRPNKWWPLPTLAMECGVRLTNTGRPLRPTGMLAFQRIHRLANFIYLSIDLINLSFSTFSSSAKSVAVTVLQVPRLESSEGASKQKLEGYPWLQQSRWSAADHHQWAKQWLVNIRFCSHAHLHIQTKKLASLSQFCSSPETEAKKINPPGESALIF